MEKTKTYGSPRSTTRATTTLIACLTLGVAALAMVPFGGVRAGEAVVQGPPGAAFYDPPQSLEPGRHGDLIWATPLATSVPNAKAWKILYWSTTTDNKTVPVSGLLIAPAGDPPAAGRPVVTWGHGTSGSSRNCAPSLAADPARDANFYFMPDSAADYDYGVPGLSRMIEAGYVVVATDYNGLGGPGVHQYLVSDTEGRNVLDAAIAARRVPAAGAGDRAVVMGWSQGGQAAVWAAQIADYASPAVKVLGAVALAPVNASAQIEAMKRRAAEGKPMTETQSGEEAMAYFAMTNVFPDLKLSDVLTPVGVEVFMGAFKAGQCGHHMSDTLNYAQGYRGPILREKPENGEAWLRRIEANSLGNTPPKVPLAVYQGEVDQAVVPLATTIYVKKACASGAEVAYIRYEGIDHIRLAARAEPDFLAWIADRFAGAPAATTCQ